MAESVGRQVDLLPAQGPGSRQRLHQPAELERVKSVPYREQGRKEAFRVLRKTIHVGKIARLIHLQHAVAAQYVWCNRGRPVRVYVRVATQRAAYPAEWCRPQAWRHASVFSSRRSAFIASSKKQQSLHIRVRSDLKAVGAGFSTRPVAIHLWTCPSRLHVHTAPRELAPLILSIPLLPSV